MGFQDGQGVRASEQLMARYKDVTGTVRASYERVLGLGRESGSRAESVTVVGRRGQGRARGWAARCPHRLTRPTTMPRLRTVETQLARPIAVAAHFGGDRMTFGHFHRHRHGAQIVIADHHVRIERKQHERDVSGFLRAFRELRVGSTEGQWAAQRAGNALFAEGIGASPASWSLNPP